MSSIGNHEIGLGNTNFDSGFAKIPMMSSGTGNYTPNAINPLCFSMSQRKCNFIKRTQDYFSVTTFNSSALRLQATA